MLGKFLIVLLVSMLPLIELRGAIPIAAGFDLPEIPALLIAMLGNMLPMPLIFIFAQDFLRWGSERKHLQKFCKWLTQKGHRAGKKLQAKNSASVYLALLLFVGVPFPGTGAWTGTLAASMLNLDRRKTIVAVSTGLVLAGTIMSIISLGLFKFIQ
jgi:uncharacterized membrane protein